VVLMMYLFFSEFKVIMKILGMSRKRLKRWVWLYVGIMLSIFGIIAFKNRDYFKKFIEPLDHQI
jgi:DMSO/TMAO reductase YedYZ heme-binding membrane subunit